MRDFMFTKYFYLIRHGETILNQKRIRQDEKGSLSSKGSEEALGVGERLKNRHIQKMFISPYERAQETAKLINQSLNLKEKRQVTTSLLAERKNPSLIVGLSYDDPLANSFINKMDKSIHDPNLRIYDEENFQDLKERALVTQKFLIQNGVKYNVCVTHGIFLKMFLATLLYGDKLTVKDYIQINLFNPTDNASITLVKYSPWKEKTRALRKFLDNLLGRDPVLDKEGLRVDRYSPWEILAYNEYVKGEALRMSI